MGISDQLLSDAGVTYPPSNLGSNGIPDYSDIDAKYGFPKGTMNAVARIESNYNPNAVSPKGAQGIFQMEPSTQKNPGYGLGQLDPNNPDDAGAYLAAMRKQAGGDLAKGLAMYNAGPAGNLNNPETNAYVKKVLQGVDTSQQTVQSTTQSKDMTSTLMSRLLSDANSDAPQSTNKYSSQLQNDASSTPNPLDKASLLRTAVNIINPANAVKGVGEFALNNATGAIGAAAGGLKGIYDLATGQGVGKATQDIQNTQQKLTYIPRSSGGQALVGAVGDAMGAVKQGSQNAGGTLGALVGGDKGRLIGESIGNIAPDIAMTLAGGRAALTGAKPLGDVANFNAPSLAEIRQAVNGTSDATPDAAVSSMGPKARYKLNADGSVSAPIGGQQAIVANKLSDLQKIQTNGVMPSSVAPPESGIGQKIAQAQNVIAQKDPTLPANQVQRHAEAQSLPVPMDLTAAQASGDPVAISNELNNRGKYPQTAQLLNAQNSALVQNLNAMREKAAPYVSGSPTDIGQSLVDSYKKMDDAAQDNVRQKYQAVTDANMGKFPLDVNQFLNNAKQALDNQNVADFVPPKVQALLGRIQQDPNMTFNNFINYDKILSQQERAAMNSPEGKTGSVAVGLIRNELNKVPAMSDTTAPAYQLLSQARATAKARFDAIDADPAYKAVVNDDTPQGFMSPLADKFVNNYIANGKAANVNYMMRNLSRDPMAQQAIKAGFLDNIRQSSGIDLRTNQGNISQAGLNKALQNAGNKTQLILGDDAHTLNTIGNVARYTQEQPRGGYVNNSGTLVGALADAAKGGVETALAVKTLGAYPAAKNIIQNVLSNRKKPSTVMLSDLNKK